MMRNKGGAVESENIRPIPREPTEAMTEAGLMAIGTPGCYVDEVWRAMWDASPPIPAASAPKGAEPQRWRHIKTGGVYEVIVDHAYVEADMTAVVVYRGETGMTFTRPSSEFHDGRFELLDGAPTDRASHGAEPTTVRGISQQEYDELVRDLALWRQELESKTSSAPGPLTPDPALAALGAHLATIPVVDAFDRAKATTGVDPGAETLWQPIETAPHGRKLIVGYPNALGNWRSVMARYFGPETLRLTDEEGYAPEGWYEECESNPDDQIYRTDEAPTHWMPLAPAPGASPPTTGEADLLREPLGEQIFGLWFKNMSLEDELFAGLEAAGMPDGYNDFWTDHYDASIEFGFVEQGFVMPQSALDHLWSIGFSRCWVNYDKEHALYFSKDIPAPGVNHNAHGSKVADGAERKRLRASIESLSSRLDMTQRDFEHSTRWRSKAYNEQAEKLDQANAENASLRDKLAEETEVHAQLQARCFDYGGTFQNVFDDLKAARVNARRYEWLRSERADLSFMFELTKDGKPLGLLALDLLDAAIDARQSAEAAEGEK